MAKFAIKYSEVYSDTYTVEAKDFTEAVCILDKALRHGEVIGPDECEDSQFVDVTKDHVFNRHVDLP